MTEPSNLPRIYGDEEIGRILKRATELQAREPTAPGAGMTLADLEEIAAEAGIDPTFLRRAALEADSASGTPGVLSRLAGEELAVTREVTLPGELTDDGFERIASVLQANSSAYGQPSLMGKTLTWRAQTDSRTTHVVVTSRDGRTHIRFEESLVQMASGIFGGLGVGAGVGVGVGVGLPLGLKVLGSAVFAASFPVGIAGVSYVACREIYRRVVRQRRRVISQLFDLVVAEAEGSIAKPLSP